jgi:hypothetical protein
MKTTCDLCDKELEIVTDSYCSDECMEIDTRKHHDSLALKWLGSKIVTSKEFEEAMDRGEYEMQQQRDLKYE